MSYVLLEFVAAEVSFLGRSCFSGLYIG